MNFKSTFFESGFAIAEFYAPNKVSLHVFVHDGEPLEEFQVEVNSKEEVGKRLKEELSRRGGKDLR